MSDDASSIEDDRKSEDSAQKMTLPFNEDTSKEGESRVKRHFPSAKRRTVTVKGI